MPANSDTSDRRGLLPALLRFWRGRRGMSQLDLAVAAEVSARHVSFLETGRSQPSEKMVLQLANALQVPLRDQNAMLVAAGFEELFEEPDLADALAGPTGKALAHMMEHHEPYPMVAMNRLYDVLQMNRGGAALLGRMVANPLALTAPVNAIRAILDPALLREFVVDWERLARHLLARLHREALVRPSDEALSKLLTEALALPGVDPTWRQPDFSQPVEPTFTMRLRRDGLALSFLTTITTFGAPQNVTLEELRIESFFPLDAATDEACRGLVGS